jgi:hypothetical protein
MVPILRTISVGGVLIALLLFVLALSPPGGSRARLMRLDAPAPPVDISEQTAWGHFVLPTVLRSPARLQDLVILRVANPVGGAAAVSGWMGAAVEAATIPVDIGEASSAELPLAPYEELPPVIMWLKPTESSAPRQRKAMRDLEPPPVSEIKPPARRAEPREKPQRTSHLRHRRARKSTPPAHFDLLQALFGTHKDKRPRKTGAAAARD